MRFGTTPIMMGEIEGANRASSLAAEDHFCSYTLNQKIELISQCMTEWLGPMFGSDQVVWIERCQPHDAEMELRKMDLAAKHGVMRANELRQFAGLPEDPIFAHELVGGRNMRTTNLIEQAIGEMVNGRIGEIGADRILEMVDPSYRGNGRSTHRQHA